MFPCRYLTYYALFNRSYDPKLKLGIAINKGLINKNFVSMYIIDMFGLRTSYKNNFPKRIYSLCFEVKSCTWCLIII